MQIIQADQYAVFHRDAKTEVETDAAGRYWHNSANATCLIFDSLEEAESYCVSKVNEIPAVVCEVYDSAGKANPPLRSVVNQLSTRYMRESASAGRRRIWLGWLLCIGSPPLFWIDWRSHGELIIPSIIGFNLLFIGFRLMIWGYGTVHNNRKTQRRIQ